MRVRAETGETTEFLENEQAMVPAGVNLEAVQLLKKLRPWPGNNQRISDLIAASEVRKGYIDWPERTLTSLEGCHL